MSNPINPMDFWDKTDHEAEGNKLAQYEHGAVDRIVKRAKVGTAERALLVSDGDLMTFEALHEHAHFPLLLHAIKIRSPADIEKTLEQRPLRTPMFMQFLDITDGTPKGECTYQGVVFNWLNHGRWYVLHDFSMHTDLGTSLRYWRINGRCYYLETLDNLVERFGPAEEWCA